MVEPRLDPKVIQHATDLLAAAIHIDRYVMHAVNRLDEDFAGIHDLVMQTFKQLSKNKHLLDDKVMIGKEVVGDEVTRNLEQITLHNEQLEAEATTPTLRLQKLCGYCDRSFEFYNDIAEMNADAAVKLMAKELAARASERIDVLKQALGNECGCDR